MINIAKCDEIWYNRVYSEKELRENTKEAKKVSEFNENALEENEEENENYITLTDDDGNDVSFEILDTVEYSGRLFAVLIPFDEEDDGVVVLEVLPSDDPDYDDFVAVEDEELVNEVFEEFKKNYQGEYDFE